MVMATDDEINTLMNIGADMLIEDEATGQQMIDYSKVPVVYEMMAVSTTARATSRSSQRCPCSPT